MKDLKRVLADAIARVLHGPRALTFERTDGALVLGADPSGRRIGFVGNLPWWSGRRGRAGEPLREVWIDEVPLFAGSPLGGTGKDNPLWMLLQAGRKPGVAMAPPVWQDPDEIERVIDEATGASPAYAAFRRKYLVDQERVTDSVPVLAAMVETWELRGRPPWPHAREWGPEGSAEHYTAQRAVAYERLVDMLDTAVWRVEIESRRWLAQDATGGYDAETWWIIFRGVLALRWALNQRRGAPTGYLPSREVAVREPAPVEPVTVGRLSWGAPLTTSDEFPTWRHE